MAISDKNGRWNYLHYLQSEQAALKMKYDKLYDFVGEILEALKTEEIKRLDTKQQGWAILEDFIAIPILGGQNCRELVNF